MEKHLQEVEGLKWQIEYEAKLNNEMKELLEHKVSTLLAEKEELQKKIAYLEIVIVEKDEAQDKQTSDYQNLEATIDTHLAEITDLKNSLDDLKCKGGELSPVVFDKLQSQLNLRDAEIKAKDSKIIVLESDLMRAIDSLKDFHQRIVKLDSFATATTVGLQDLVDEKIKEQTDRITEMTETFKEALLLSNKTYFLEEMSKQKIIHKNLRKEVSVFKDKYKASKLEL